MPSSFHSQSSEESQAMTVTLEDAQAHLADLVAKAAPGEEIVITQDDKPVARLVAENVPTMQPRVPGSAKGMIAYMADDFDAPLEDFN
jgi:prevent-host-death family protein